MRNKIKTTLVAISSMLLPFLVSAQGFPIPGGGPVDESTASGLIIRIIQILLAVAGLVAVIFLIVGGFRYITAGGNEETAESAKKTITNAIIGVVIIILAFVIVRIIANALINQQV